MSKSDIMIGSMLWVFPGESREEMEKDVRGMLDSGLVIARIFLGGGSVEAEEDQWDFSTYDRLFSVCEELGLKLTVTLGTLGAPAWVARKFENMPPSREQFDYKHKRIHIGIEKIVNRYKDSPAVHSWILQNEPALRIRVDACTLPMFRQWLLEEKYGYDVEAIRRAYRSNDAMGLVEFAPNKRELTEEEKEAARKAYQPVAERIGRILPDGSAELNGVTTPSWVYNHRIDWANFNAWLMEKLLGNANRLVKSLDPNHPTTINPDGVAYQFPGEGGRNLYGQGKTVDFMGCSCHVSWHSSRFALERVHQSVAMYCDLMRSCTADPDGYYWITELQSGTNYFSGNRPMVPKASDITHWLWEAIATGCKGMIYWLYRARTAGFEGLEWGLIDQQDHPSRRSRASKAVADVVYGNKELFGQTKPRKYDGYILHSYDSINLSYSDRQTLDPRPGDIDLPRNSNMVRDALCGAYLMLQDAGLDVGFAYEHELEGRIENGSFLVAPNTYGLDPAVLEKLRDYVANGGTLLVDGLFGVKNPYGYRSDAKAQKLMGELFSSPVDDWGVDTQPISFRMEDGTDLPAWFLTCCWDNEEPLTVLARDEEGYACAIEHKLGKGRAIYIGTQFFQSYFAHNGVEGYVELLKKLLPAPKREYTLENLSTFLRLKVLEGERDIVILMNRKDAAEAIVTAETPTDFVDLISGEEFHVDKSSPIPMGKLQVRALAQKA